MMRLLLRCVLDRSLEAGRPGTERLGQALRGNTHVNSLQLYLSCIDEGEDVTELLQFIGQSAV